MHVNRSEEVRRLLITTGYGTRQIADIVGASDSLVRKIRSKMTGTAGSRRVSIERRLSEAEERIRTLEAQVYGGARRTLSMT